MTPASISRALSAHQRRAATVAFMRAGLIAAGIALLALELARLGPDLLPVGAAARAMATFAAGLVVSGLYARAVTPSALDVARHLDRSARAQDLFVTAVEREDQRDEMSAAIARAASAALAAIPPPRAYPFEWPRQWRRWAALAVAVQALAIVATWRSPDARTLPASGAALSLPGSAAGSGTGGAAAAASPGAAATGAPTPPPDTAALTAAKPADARDTSAATSTSNDAAAAGSGAAAGNATASAPGTGSAETRDTDSRYRQAAAQASDAVAHGRVPAALRGVVERYFIAIRSQGKRTP